MGFCRWAASRFNEIPISIFNLCTPTIKQIEWTGLWSCSKDLIYFFKELWRAWSTGTRPCNFIFIALVYFTNMSNFCLALLGILLIISIYLGCCNLLNYNAVSNAKVIHQFLNIQFCHPSKCLPLLCVKHKLNQAENSLCSGAWYFNLAHSHGNWPMFIVGVVIEK